MSRKTDLLAQICISRIAAIQRRSESYPVLLELIEEYLNADYYSDFCSQNEFMPVAEGVHALKMKIQARKKIQLFTRMFP